MPGRASERFFQRSASSLRRGRKGHAVKLRALAEEKKRASEERGGRGIMKTC